MSAGGLWAVMGVAPHAPGVILNAPPGWARPHLTQPDAPSLAEPEAVELTWGLAFCATVGDGARFAAILRRALVAEAPLWLARPDSEAIDALEFWAPVRASGLLPAAKLRLDPVWEATRFQALRPPDRVTPRR